MPVATWVGWPGASLSVRERAPVCAVLTIEVVAPLSERHYRQMRTFHARQRVCYNALTGRDGCGPSGNKCQGGATMAESDFTVYYDFR